MERKNILCLRENPFHIAKPDKISRTPVIASAVIWRTISTGLVSNSSTDEVEISMIHRPSMEMPMTKEYMEAALSSLVVTPVILCGWLISL